MGLARTGARVSKMCGMEVGISSLASKVHCLSPLSSNHGATRFLFQVLVGHDLLGLLLLLAFIGHSPHPRSVIQSLHFSNQHHNCRYPTPYIGLASIVGWLSKFLKWKLIEHMV